jgi:CS domain
MSKLSDYSKFDHLDSDDDDDDDDDDEGQQQKKANSSSTAAAKPQAPPTIAELNSSSSSTSSSSAVGGVFTRDTGGERAQTNRFIFEYPPGNPIYSWEQTLDSVTLYIPTPRDVVTRASQLDCRIHPNRLQVGMVARPRSIPDFVPKSSSSSDGNENHIDDNNFFLDEPTYGTVDIHNSTWTWENDILTVELFKANKGVVWRAVTLGCDNNNNNNNTNVNTAAQLDPFQLEQEQKRLLLERWQEENPGMDFRNAEFNGSVPDPRTFMGGVRYD